MINFNFNIRNPWSGKWKHLFLFHGSAIFEHKFWELQVYRSSDIVDVNFQITARQSHSGVRLGLGLLSFNCEFQFYDSRHWDSDTDTWKE